MRGIEYTENLYGIRHGGGDGVEIPPPVTLRIGPNNYLIECKGQKSDEFKKQRNVRHRQTWTLVIGIKLPTVTFMHS